MTPRLTSAPTSSAVLWLSFSPSSHSDVRTRRVVNCSYVAAIFTYTRAATTLTRSLVFSTLARNALVCGHPNTLQV